MKPVFCSTIIPTIGRDTLTRAVRSILEQEFTADDFEVIVVNDSGHGLPDAEWQRSPRVQMVSTQRRDRSVARNTGAAIARGRFLHFLDDDDWLLPGALEAFWSLSHDGTAAWFYGGTRIVDEESRCLVELHLGMRGNCFAQVMAGEWIPLQASIIDAKAFFQVGGFGNSMLTAEDIDLCRRVAMREDFTFTPRPVVSIQRGQTWKTSSDYGKHADYSRRARENVLHEARAFSRMRASARSPYWDGRIVRVYWTSAVWNWQRSKILYGISRALWGLYSLVLALPHVASLDFWRALTRKHMWTVSDESRRV